MAKPTYVLVTAFVLSLAGAPAVAAEVDGPKVEWRFSTWGKPRAFTKGMEVLADIVDKKTGGNFTIRVYYGEALSKSRENLDGIKLGAFDGAQFCNFYHPGKNPAFMVFSLPFLPLGDWEVSREVRNTLYQHPALVADMDRWNAIAYVSTILPQYEFLGKGKPPTRLSDWEGIVGGAGRGRIERAFESEPRAIVVARQIDGMHRIPCFALRRSGLPRVLALVENPFIAFCD